MHNNFINKIKEKMPSRIYTHEADLDGFTSGHILLYIAKFLFNKFPELIYINYDRLNEVSSDENEVIWVSDLNYNTDMDDNINGSMFIIDHHKWGVNNPLYNKIYHIHDTTKSASLLCFDLFKEIVNNSKPGKKKLRYQNIINEIKPLVIQTNIGDTFICNNNDELITARGYSRCYIEYIKPYIHYNVYQYMECTKFSVLKEFYRAETTEYFVENYKDSLKCDKKIYENLLKDKNNEIKPGIFNFIYEKCDYSMIFKLILDEHPNIKAILTAIKNPRTDSWSLSVRSKDNKTAYYIAKNYFNGGGHPNAAGAILPINKSHSYDNCYDIESIKAWNYIKDKLKDYKDIE